MKLLTDNAINSLTEDKFNFKSYANLFAEIIKDTTHLPFSIGIYGPWGCGKSSLLKLMQEAITAQKVKSIWFNPWKYDTKIDIWNGLIQTILEKFKEDFEKEKANDELKQKALKFGKKALLMGLKKGVPLFTGGIINKETIDSVFKSVEDIFGESDENDIYGEHVNKFEESFNEIIKDYVGKDGKFVIFIDDLDRCLPENALMVLEATKLFLSSPNCVFVFGMDKDIVQAGISVRYKNYFDMTGIDYLDKIIQVPFYVPSVDLDLLKSLHGELNDYNVLILSIIQIGLQGNPRKTKRFFNSFSILKKLFGDTKLENFEIHLAKLLVIQLSFPDFYDFLKKDTKAWYNFEKQVIKAASTDDRNQFFISNKGYQKFYENLAFVDFMKQTGFNYASKIDDKTLFPKPPEDVNYLIQISKVAPVVD